MQIKIDTSTLNDDQRKDPEFLELYQGVQDLFTNILVVNSFCVHEAGHVIYYQRAGVPIHGIVRPSIVYAPSQEAKLKFRCHPAQVQVKRSDVENLGTDPDVVSKIAKVHAAGEVAALALTSLKTGGGEIDKQNFKDYCELANIPESERRLIWKTAGDEIKKELRQPAAKSEAWQEAFNIRRQLFGIPVPPAYDSSAIQKP